MNRSKRKERRVIEEENAAKKWSDKGSRTISQAETLLRSSTAVKSRLL